MTPQLQQAIKLLALSNLEIEAFIGEALEANPLLEAGEVSREEAVPEPDGSERAPEEPTSDELMLAGRGEDDAPLDIDPTALDRDRDTGDWSAQAASSEAGDQSFDLEQRGDDETTLAEHLEAQVGAQARDPQIGFIARTLIGLLDEAGYLATPLQEVAESLGAPLAEVTHALELVQSLDPTGVGARSLAECLALQAREADRYDPCMQALVANLDLLARGDFTRLKRICSVDDEDFAEMLAELRGYDPKPGLRIGGGERSAVIPDVLVSRIGATDWDISINAATLPRLVVNRGYYVALRSGSTDKRARSWLNEKLADANWLIRALDQRQKTILKVAAEIVRRQDGFFRRGVSHLRPLTLRGVAEAIDMHESTVSRVTSNKYLCCERGTFELKYFFTSGVASADGEEGASSEAVKARIRALVDAEDSARVLSDDKLVELLKAEGFELARRTVAKYREAIGIGSSVERRRQKKLARVG
jgi:RNA polymerase sigma-54 factor